MNIGDDNQAFAILHGELTHEVGSMAPHLLVTWLYWEQDSEPVYQNDYCLDSDEVMPSDELDIIPFTSVNDVLCPLEDLPRVIERCDDQCPIFWKRRHVYVSSQSTVTVRSHHLPHSRGHSRLLTTSTGHHHCRASSNRNTLPRHSFSDSRPPTTRGRPSAAASSHWQTRSLVQ